jgi:MFS family permease
VPPAIEAHISEITRVIQLAVAPVFLLTAIGTIINALNVRLGRVVDRRRVMQDQEHSRDEQVAKAAKDELVLLARRARLIYHAVFAAVASALLVCLVVAVAFVGALMTLEVSRLVAVLFILAMGALIVSLAAFLREIYVAVTEGAHIRWYPRRRGEST